MIFLIYVEAAQPQQIVTKNNELDPREDQIEKLIDATLNEASKKGLLEYIQQVRNR